MSTNDNTDALPPLEQQIDEYIDGYTLEGDDGYYTPNDTERLIAKDVVMGLLAEPWFVAAFAAQQGAQVPRGADRWVIVCETVLDVGLGDDVRTGGKPELGYALIAHAVTYASQEEAAAAIRSAGLPIGWVYMPLSRLLPDLPAALPKAPAQSEPSDRWYGAEEWMPLAWELCADECGEEACNELVWEGGPVPEPWGERWLKYEYEAKRLIALVRQHVPAASPQRAVEPLHVTILIDWLAARYRAAGGKDGITDLSAFAEEVMRWTETRHGITKEQPKA